MKYQIVSPLRWLQTLGDPAYSCHFDLKGTPMFFDARPGWRAKNALQDQHMVYFCRSGVFGAKVDGKIFAVRPGGMIWVQPGVGFEFYINPGETVRIARFRLRVSRRNGLPVRLGRKFFQFARTGLARAWLDQIRLFANAQSTWAQQAQRAALAGFFATVLEAHAQEKGGPHERSLNASQLARLEHFVELRGSRPCSPADLAGHIELAPAYFNRLFRATLGCSARAWLIDRRIHAAAQQLVESDRRISEVADEFGYASLFFFSRQFRKIMGVSPRIFREKSAMKK